VSVERPTGLPEVRQPAGWGSDVVVDLLTALDVPYVPLNPGSSFRGLHDSLVNHGGNVDPQLLLCLHEEVAVALAHGWAKATGRLGVAAIHDLVGLQHASMAVYDAFCDRTPLLLLGGSGPADPAQRRPIDWIHSATTQAQLVRDFTVWDAEPMTPAAFVADVARARQRALSAPQGPAYVSLDAGVQEAKLDQPVPLPDLDRHAPAPPMAAHPDSIERAVEALVNARYPVIVAGRVGLDPRATAAVSELVELLGAAYRDDRNMVVLPTRHPQNCTGDPALMADADVVLAIDVVDLNALLRTRDRGPRGADAGEQRQGPVVIDLSHGDLAQPSWTNAFGSPLARDVQLLADPLTGVAQLVAALRDRLDGAAVDVRRAQVTDRVRALREKQTEELRRRWDDRPISPARLVAETWAAVRDVAHLLCVRNTRTWPEGVWELPGAGSYLGHSGGGGVGYGPGALVGGALAARDRGQLGIGLLGDGDLLMASSALWTAVHYSVPALVVVNDNSSFYNDEPHQVEVAEHRGRPAENSWIGMRIADPNVDIAGLARSYGCWAEGPVEDPDDLAGALARGVEAAAGGAVAVVHVRTAPR
jgi:thiamine pyrophosphate-dependent acetolactate synthase large subunit-like protein